MQKKSMQKKAKQKNLKNFLRKNKNKILKITVCIVFLICIYLVFFKEKNTSVTIGYDMPKTQSYGVGYFDEKMPNGLSKSPKRGEYIHHKDNSVMVYIPQDAFLMGDDNIFASKPVYRVEMSGYYIDKYEITVGQYKIYCDATNSIMPIQPQWNTDDHPVVNVNWHEAKAYADWTGKQLPTEAQWEKAAKGGINIPEFGGSLIPITMKSNNLINRIYPWGNGFPNLGNSYRCNYRADDNIAFQGKDGYLNASPVGSFFSQEGSVYGCCDLIGNVAEWCQNWYVPKYDIAENKDPKGPKEGTHKVIRGGSWSSTSDLCRIGYRLYKKPEEKRDDIGFRLVLEGTK